jgi:two-component system, cell cycle sensor histidine kinase and response regulator CckA
VDKTVILLVDDELLLLRVMDRILRQEGYTVHMAVDGPEALRIAERIENAKGEVHLLVVDYMMPGMTGGSLVMHVKDKFPEIKVLYVTGRTIFDPAIDIDAPCLMKPFSLESLKNKVKEVLNS